MLHVDCRYPCCLLQVLDATFDDVTPLALARMPQSWSELLLLFPHPSAQRNNEPGESYLIFHTYGAFLIVHI